MSIMIPLIFLIVAFIWNIFPYALLLTEMLFDDPKAEREKEWRILASKLALTELRMLSELNITRQQMGMSPLPYKPVVAHLKGMAWGGLTLRIKESVRNSLTNIFWKPTE